MLFLLCSETVLLIRKKIFLSFFFLFSLSFLVNLSFIYAQAASDGEIKTDNSKTATVTQKTETSKTDVQDIKKQKTSNTVQNKKTDVKTTEDSSLKSAENSKISEPAEEQGKPNTVKNTIPNVSQNRVPDNLPSVSPIERPEDIQKGIEFFCLDEMEKAYLSFKTAFEKDSELAPPGITLGQLYMEERQFQKVRECLERTVDEYPNDPEAYLIFTGAALEVGHLTEAKLLLDQAEKLLSVFPDSVELTKNDEKTSLNSADQESVVPDSTNANHSAQKAISSKKTSQKSLSRKIYLQKEFLSLKATFFYAKKRLDESEKYLKQALELDVSDDQMLTRLGLLLFEEDKQEESQTIFDRAFEQNPKNVRGYLLVARLLEQKNQRAKAVELVEKNYDSETATQNELIQLAQLQIRWNELEKAQKTADLIQKKFLDCAELPLILGDLAMYRKDFALAQELYQTVLKSYPNHFDANYHLILALVENDESGLVQTAQNLARVLWQQYPQSTEAASCYAWTLIRDRQFQEAEKILAPMFQNQQMNSTIAYYLALVALNKEEKSLARQLLDAAVQSKDNFFKRSDALELQKVLDGENLTDSQNTSSENSRSNEESDVFFQFEE